MITIQSLSTVARTVISSLHKSAKELKPIVNELPYKLVLRMQIEDNIEKFKNNSHPSCLFYEGIPLPPTSSNTELDATPEIIDSIKNEIRNINNDILSKTPTITYGDFSSIAQSLINQTGAIVEAFHNNPKLFENLKLSKEELSALEDIFSVLSTELLINYANSNRIVTRPVRIKDQDFIMIDEPIGIRIYDHLARECGRLARESKK